MVTDSVCQCGAWSQTCTAQSVGTRGLCAACITGKCGQPPPVTPGDAVPPHSAPRPGAPARRGGPLGAPPGGPRDHVF